MRAHSQHEASGLFFINCALIVYVCCFQFSRRSSRHTHVRFFAAFHMGKDNSEMFLSQERFFKLDLIFKENGDHSGLGIPFFIFIFLGGGGESMQKELLRTGEVTGAATFRNKYRNNKCNPLNKTNTKINQNEKTLFFVFCLFQFFFQRSLFTLSHSFFFKSGSVLATYTGNLPYDDKVHHNFLKYNHNIMQYHHFITQ